MNKKIKDISTFIITILFFICLLLVINFIPQGVIKNNIIESVENIKTYEEYNLSKLPQIRTNNLEELYILEVLYYHNSSDNINSTLVANYNQIRKNDTDYISTVKNMMNINSGLDSYGQYWNGMNIILRPLFILFSLTQIKIILGIILLLLSGLYIYMCEKNNLRRLWISYIISAIMTGVFFTPISLEYIWTFLVMIIGANLILLIKKDTPSLFIIFGVATAFFTHHTNALIIFMVMLLTYFEKYKTNENFKKCIISIFGLFIRWMTSFVITIALKWIITTLCCNVNLNLINEHKLDLSTFQLVFNSIYLNVSRLLPLNPTNSSTANMIIFFVVVLVYMYFLYIYKTKNINHKKVTLYLYVAFLPIINLILDYNYFYIYNFSTYRIFLGTIMCTILIAFEMSGFCNSKDNTVSNTVNK